MSIIRVEKTRDYTVMSNYHLRDKNLSLKAKGLMSFMLSLPDDWDYSVEGLVSVCKEGREAIQSSLKELEENKYLVRTMTHNSQGKFEYIYDLFEKPTTEQPQTEKPSTVNQEQINTNKTIIKKTNNKEYNDAIIEIIDYLNTRAGTKYSYNGKEQVKNITARLKEKYEIDDFKIVIDKKVAEWKGTDMAKYIRPETLFGNKFESYLNQQGFKSQNQKYLDRNDKNNFEEFFDNLENMEI